MIKKSVFIFFICIFIVTATFAQKNSATEIIQRKGVGKVRLVQYRNGHWQMLVEEKPYFIKGVVYEPVKVGLRLKESNSWMNYDFNQNAIVDTAYESWADINGNNRKDKNEPAVGDFYLLKEMGCNTIRIYHPTNIKKEVLGDLYERFGIRVMMGNFLGAYTWGSGANWKKGTDYTDPAQRKNMMEDVRRMVMDFKDEPYILFWMLGNENDCVGSSENSTLNNTNAGLVPKIYAEFINEVAGMIHELDPNHPVGISNCQTGLLKYYAQYSPQIDIVGMNAYKGFYGFGTLWNAVKFDFDRPLVVTEYGTDCYDQNTNTVDEDFQATYYRNSWRDMKNNSFAYDGIGNSLGGFAYNWLDSWWLCGSSEEHDVEKGAWRGPTKDSWMNDEWMAICGQGDGSQSPFLRQLRKVYYTLQEEWRSNL